MYCNVQNTLVEHKEVTAEIAPWQNNRQNTVLSIMAKLHQFGRL